MRNWTQTVTAKVLGVGVLALLMLIPLAQVQSLVTERQAMRETAVTQIAQGWGGQQILGGPVLAIPGTRNVLLADNQATRDVATTDVVLPDDLQTEVSMQVQSRRYGIYAAPVYLSTVHVTARFLPEDVEQAKRASTSQWKVDKAELRFLLSDLRGLRSAVLRIDGKPARFASSAERMGGLSSVVVPVPLDSPDGKPIDVDIQMELAGTEAMQVLPLGRSSDVAIKAPWGDPSFIGAALPVEREIRPEYFSARWHASDLNRSYGQYWEYADAGIGQVLGTSAFGVQLYQPVDIYQRSERSVKYGLLFIGMTFVVFFLFEVLKRMRVHPVQYLLIGAALATFYVLLLALSEQIGFAPAYLAAASAVVLIVGGYAASVLRARRAGLLLGGALALVYALLYGLVAAEQYALLAGAFALLAAVALLMYLTRRIDWYGYAPVSAQRSDPATMERS
ncbi:MAG TPA: cell envelope integrity protein CreD [Dyella sp.]|uniref:cell envelope integrity protein CreD n=1 Tax=Dyella sp. TaxID=1869338 RepID=UPI002F939093